VAREKCGAEYRRFLGMTKFCKIRYTNTEAMDREKIRWEGRKEGRIVA